jgi:hypothetical protein
MECKLWKPITQAFNLPPTATSSSTQFRLYYEKMLLSYEDRCARAKHPRKRASCIHFIPSFSCGVASACLLTPLLCSFCSSARSFFSGQLLRGAPRPQRGLDSSGGAAGEEDSGDGTGGLKRTASDAGFSSGAAGGALDGAPPKRAAPAGGGGAAPPLTNAAAVGAAAAAAALAARAAAAASSAPQQQQPPPRSTTPAPAPVPAPAPAPTLNPSQQAAALLTLLQPSVGPYMIIPPHFEVANVRASCADA